MKLSAAIANHHDFVLTWEPQLGEAPEPVIYIMTGNLITPCRLNGLRDRAKLFEDEGARIVMFKSRTVSARLKNERECFRNL